MDKKTLLAIVVAVVVITIGFFIQSRITENRKQESGITEQEVREPEAAAVEETEAGPTALVSVQEDEVEQVASDEDLENREIVEETDFYRITFSTEGGTIRSLKLKEHLEKNGKPVDMIFRGESEMDAFEIHFGRPNVEPVDEVFEYTQVGPESYEFSRKFYAPGKNGGKGDIFTLKKRYVFMPREYMFELQVTIENSRNEYPNLNDRGTAYSLQIGPQIGPEFEKLDGRRAFRKYVYYSDGKKKNLRMSRDGVSYLEERALWSGITGKYFSVIVVPDATNYEITFYQMALSGLPVGSQMFLSRPVIKSSNNTDVYRIYAGPNLKKEMARYNNPDKNTFGIRDYDLEKAIDRSKILGWLESILKWILLAFYRLIPNYGVAIILLTIVIKIVVFPITRKSYDSTSRMQELNPKIQEIREKYKDNPQKMNQEIQALYKKNKVSPLGGCLPLLLQMPIFIALYGLLNSHFDLRGAVFIPGWINDLSSPESIWNFAPTSLPLLGSDLRLLPILFVGTQLISSKLMQTPSTSSQGNMKIMTYAMPIVFFFMLYDAPSGLILYWTVTNILTVVQQWAISKIKKRKEEK
jgi:YidC/Oxa1 family membrane protein insertase